MVRPFGVTDGDTYTRSLERRVSTLERVGVLTGAAPFMRVVQAHTLISSVPEETTQVFVSEEDPRELNAVTEGAVWKDTSYPEPIIRVYEGGDWIKSTDPQLDRAMTTQNTTVEIHRDATPPPEEHRRAGSLWQQTTTGVLYRWQDEDWVETPIPGQGQLALLREEVDGLIVGGTGNIITWTDVLAVDAPGPPPSPDPDRKPGDIHWNRDSITHMIYASYLWDGSVWNATTFGNEVLDSLDVGKLVAVTGTLDSAVINEFFTKMMTVGSITPAMLASTEELSVNPSWSRAELRNVPPYQLGTGMTFATDPTRQYRGGSHVLQVSNGGAGRSVRITATAETVPGELIYGQMIMRKTDALPPLSGSALNLVAHWLDDDGTEVGTATYEIVHTAGTTWTPYETLFEAPNGVSSFYVTVDGGSAPSSTWLVGQTSVRRTLSSVSDENIQTVVSPGGVEVSILVEVEDNVWQRVPLTSMGRFYSAFDPDTGQTSTLTGTTLSTGVVAARDDVTIGGESLLGLLGAGAKLRILDRGADDTVEATNEIGYREFGFDAIGGHAYILILQADVRISSAGQSYVFLRKTQSTTGDAPPPTIAGTPERARHSWYAVGGGEQVYLMDVFTPTVSGNTRWLLSGRSGGTRTFQFRESWAIVIELGDYTELPSTGRYSDGGATPVVPVPPQQKVHTSVFDWTRTYNNFNSNPSSWVDADLMRQGVGGSSRYMALMGMSTAARNAAMAGTINKIEVYLYHDGPTPGGTAKIGTHRQASMPAHSAATSITLYNTYKDSYLNRSEGKWITLPSAWYADFQSGLTRGLSLGSVTGSWALMDFANQNHSETSNDLRRPRIRITYTVS